MISHVGRHGEFGCVALSGSINQYPRALDIARPLRVDRIAVDMEAFIVVGMHVEAGWPRRWISTLDGNMGVTYSPVRDEGRFESLITAVAARRLARLQLH